MLAGARRGRGRDRGGTRRPRRHPDRAGQRAFCVGADIVAWSALDPSTCGGSGSAPAIGSSIGWRACAQPLIAVLNGPALGGGLELAMTADLRIVEAHAKLGLPEAASAPCPGWSGTQRLVRRVGPQAAKRLALTGEPITAEAALRLGLVGRNVPDREWAQARPGHRSRHRRPGAGLGAAGQATRSTPPRARRAPSPSRPSPARSPRRPRTGARVPRASARSERRTTGTGDGVTSLENEAGRLCSAPLCGVPSPSRRPDPHLATASGTAAIRLRRGEGEDHTVGKGKILAVSGRRRS